MTRRLELRDFRNYEAAELELPAGLAVVRGPERRRQDQPARGRSTSAAPAARRAPRTSASWSAAARRSPRVVVDTRDDEAAHRLEVGFEPGEAKRLRVDGSAVDSLSTLDARPLVSVFMPERLELVKGAPAGRRAHLDQVVAALWPARAGARSRLLARARPAQRPARADPRRASRRRPRSTPGTPSWRARGIALMEDRAEAVDGPRRSRFAGLGAAARPAGPGGAALPAALGRRGRRRPRGRAGRAPRRRPRARLHRARPPPRRARSSCSTGSTLRAYGSQGQQRTALLALLFAERELLSAAPRPPAADAARRRDVRARRRAPRAAGRAAALGRPGDRHRHRGRARARASAEDELVRVGAGTRCSARWRREAREARVGSPRADSLRRLAQRAVPRGAPGRACSRAVQSAWPEVAGTRAGGGRHARFGARRDRHRGLRVGRLGARAGAARRRTSSPA